MWMYLLVPVFFGAGYVLCRMQTDQNSGVVSPGKFEGQMGQAREDQFGHLRSILLALHELQGQHLDTSHMDELLELEELESEETKRSRRARVVSDVNSWGWAEYNRPILVRERDETDRRRTLFEVAAFELPPWM